MLKTLMIAACALTLAACGTDDVKDALGIEDEADAGAVEVDIDTDKDTIGELEEDEKDAICQTLGESINAGVSFRTRCGLAAVAASTRSIAEGEAAVRAACEEAFEPCELLISTGKTQSVPDIPIPDCPLFKGDTSGCASAVVDLEACLTQLGQQTADSLRALSCDALTTDIALDPPDIGDTIRSRPDQGPCAAVSTECPGVFGTAEE